MGFVRLLVLLFTCCILGNCQFTIEHNLSGSWVRTFRTFSPRQKHDIVCVGNVVWLFGGRLDNSNTASDLWRFDLQTGLWDEVFPAGDIRPHESHSMEYVTGSIYIFGGRFGNELNGQVYQLDVARNQWVEFSDEGSRRPLSRYRHASSAPTTRPNTMVVLFGIGQDRLFNDVWSFDVVTHLWTELHTGGGSAPTPRFNPCCDYSGGSTYCFGGTDAEEDRNDLWAFNHNTNTWTQLSGDGTPPSSRRLASCAFHSPTQFVVFNGFSSSEGRVVSANEIYIFDTTLRKWEVHSQEPSPAGPVPMDGSRSCKSSQGIVALGGNDVDSVQHNDVWLIEATLKFRKLQSKIDFPESRARHAHGIVGGYMYVISGQSDEVILDDAWEYDLENGVWEQVLQSHRIPGRVDAACVTRGSSIWLFGGQKQLDIESYTNEMIVFETISGNWRVVASQSPPEGRIKHGMVDVNDLLVVFGGNTFTRKFNNDMYVLDPSRQEWFPVDVYNAPSPRRGHYLGYDVNTNQLIVAGGEDNQGMLLDRYVADASTLSSLTLTFVKRPSIILAGSSGLIRAQHATADVGSHLISCGGMISPRFPAKAADSCFQYNRHSGVNARMPAAPTVTVDGHVTYHQHKLFFFGGFHVKNGILQKRTTNVVSIFEPDRQQVCRQSGSSARNFCIHCSPGTSNPFCVPASAGTYQPNPLKPPLLCPQGTFSAIIGAQTRATCESCPIGTFNDEKGASSCKPCAPNITCPIGTTQSSGVLSINESSIPTAQPSICQEGEIPGTASIVFMVIAVFILLFCLLLAFIERILRFRHYREFITVDQEPEIAGVFERSLPAGQKALDGGALYVALKFGLHANIHEEETHKLMLRFDVDGSNFLDLEEFHQVIIYLISLGKMAPFRDTIAFQRREETGRTTDRPSFCQRLIRGLQLKDLDLFITEHRTQPVGEPHLVQENTAGGVFSLVFILGSALVICLLVVTVYYTNNIETRSILPEVAAPTRPIKGDIEIRVVASGPVDESLCINADGSCSSSILVYQSMFAPINTTTTAQDDEELPLAPVTGNSTMQLKCRHDISRCQVDIQCRSCTVRSVSRLSVNFAAKDFFADSLLATVSAKTGILGEQCNGRTTDENLLSIDSEVFKPPSSSGVLRGYPASVAVFELTPTLFERSVRAGASLAFPIETAEGYHAQTLATRTQLGNVATAQQFPQFSGVPLDLKFEVASTLLQVERRAKETPLQIIATILGAISGISGLCISAVRILDWLSLKCRQHVAKRQNAKQRRQSLAVPGGSTAPFASNSFDDMSASVFSNESFTDAIIECEERNSKLRGLLQQRITPMQAYAILGLCELVSEEKFQELMRATLPKDVKDEWEEKRIKEYVGSMRGGLTLKPKRSAMFSTQMSEQSIMGFRRRSGSPDGESFEGDDHSVLVDGGSFAQASPSHLADTNRSPSGHLCAGPSPANSALRDSGSPKNTGHVAWQGLQLKVPSGKEADNEKQSK